MRNDGNVIFLYPTFIRKGKHKLELINPKSLEEKLLLENLPKKRIVRASVVGILNNGTVSFGVAFTSAKDNFVRSVGRNIAYGRAKSCPIRISPLNAPDNMSIKRALELGTELVKDILNKNLPMSNPKRKDMRVK